MKKRNKNSVYVSDIGIGCDRPAQLDFLLDGGGFVVQHCGAVNGQKFALRTIEKK